MIERIPNYYINDECVLLSLPFRKCITIICNDISNGGILCHYDFTDDSQNINKYLLDDRKYNFPFANIPIYKGLFGRHYVSQLFEYNKHYLCISSGFIRDRYLVRDGESAVMLNRKLYIPNSIKGNIYCKKEIRKILDNFNKYILFDRFGKEYSYNDGYIEEIDDFINNGGGIFVFKDRDNNIKLRMIRIIRDIGLDNYLYKEYVLSLNDYTSEELKYFSSKFRDVRDICVCSFVNPNIDKKLIRENKKLVRKLSNK